MRSRSGVALLVFAIISCLFWAACGGSSNSGGGGSTPPVITTSSLPGGTVNVAYSQTLSATSGTPPYSWSVTSGSLPAGLTLSSGGTISGTPTASGTSTFTVQVTDAKALTASASLSISIEGVVTITTASPLPGGTQGVAYSTTLAASGGTSPYTWSITAGSLPAGLALSSSGVISGTPTGAGTSTFTVQVKDSESTPAVASKQFSLTIQGVVTITTSSLPNGTAGVAYSATLAATGGVTPYTWSITSGSLPAGLALDAGSGTISGTPTASGSFPITVQAQDSETPPAKATAQLTLTIAKGTVTITTTSLPNGVVNAPYNATLTASGGVAPYTWTVTQGSLPAGLSLSSSGVISGTPTGTGTSNFTVQVADSENPSSTATANLSISIYDPLKITTTSLPNGTVGLAYSANLAATGGLPPYTWSITVGSLPAGLNLDKNTGAISGTPTAAGTSNFTVQVADSQNPSATATANLSITIVAALQITTASLPDGTVGVVYDTTLVATGGTPPYTWSVVSGNLPPGLNLNASTGEITGTPTGSGTANFTIQVADSGSPQQKATKAFTINIYDPLKITTSSLPNGIVGVGYSATLAATGGKSPYTWSISAGSLPAGLSLNASTGAITGTPTTVGTSNFTVKVTDSASPASSTTADLSITIVNPLQITTASLPDGTVGVVYDATLAATGGTPPYTWSVVSGNLPAGLSLNASTGEITGTPTGSGTANFTIQVADSESPQQKTTKAFTINIYDPLQITTSSLPDGNVGVTYSATLAATGGKQPYTWSISAGSLPDGLSLNASSGAITGTPTTPGTSNFTVKVTDSASPSSSTTANLSITILNTLQITTKTLPNGAVNQPYSATLKATGGTTPYTWSVVSGSLPAGLSLDPGTGNISGTPTTLGTSNFTVQVADSSQPQQTATANLSITITQLAITNTTLPSGTQTVTYSATLTATGGTTPYTWCVLENSTCDSGTGGALPSGLSLSTGGVISGVPGLTAQNSSFTVQVTDSSSPALTATANLSIAINKSAGAGILNGSYVFSLNGYSGTSNAQPAFFAGSFVADGKGNITSGVLDRNGAAPPFNSTFTGTYVIQANGLGSMTVNTTAGAFTFSVAVNSTTTATHGALTLNGSGVQTAGSGSFRAQTAVTGLSDLIGNFASGLSGIDPTKVRQTGAGAYSISQQGSAIVLQGSADVNDGGNMLTFTTTSSPLLTLDTTTGRGTAIVFINSKQTDWAFYVASANDLIFIPTDAITASPTFIGLQSLLRQSTSSFDNSYLNGVSALEVQGLNPNGGNPVASVALGLLTADGAGNASTSIDENNGGNVSLQQTASGTYSVAGNGRLTFGGGFGSNGPIAYLVTQNQAFAVGQDTSATFGYVEPQSGSPFTNLSFIGSYWGGTVSPAAAAAGNTAGWLFPDGNGTFIGALCNGIGCPSGQEIPVGGTYATDSTGRIVVSSGGNQTAIIYVISPTKAALLPLPANPNDVNPALGVFSTQ